MQHQRSGESKSFGAEDTNPDDGAFFASPIATFGSTVLELDRTQPSHGTVVPETTDQDDEVTPMPFDARSSLLQQQIATPVLHTHSLYRVGSTFFKRQQELAMVDSVSTSHLATKRLQPLGSQSTSSLRNPSRSPEAKTEAETKTKTTTKPDKVLRFYSIERLAENAFHAVKSKRKLWCFLPGVDERARSNRVTKNPRGGPTISPRNSRSYASMSDLERPSKRSDVVDLDNAFEHAMTFVCKKSEFQEALPTEQNAMIDREWMVCRQRVDQQYAFANGNATTTFGDPQQLETIQMRLVKCLMQQKWADIVLGELQSMLMGSFLEQGVLLGKVREQYAVAFDDLELLLQSNVLELSRANDEIAQKRDEVAAHSVRLEQLRNEMLHNTETELAQQRSEFDKQRDELEHKAQEAKEQVAKMTETMKTLNTIFRQMREDSDKVRAVELKESYAKLEKKMEAHKEELEKLRPLVVANQRLEEQKREIADENEQLKAKLKYSQELLESKDQLVDQLMHKQSELLANEELRRHQQQQQQAQATGGSNATEDAAGDQGADADSNNPDQLAGLTMGLDRSTATTNLMATQLQQALAQLGGRKDQSVLCIRCRQSLSGTNAESYGPSAIGDGDNSDRQQQLQLAARQPGVPRVQCVYFRILLPNLNGKRPQKGVSWTLSVIRSILFAKQLDDAVLSRKNVDVSLASNMRFPEFVYAWFEPWKSLKETKSASYEPGNAALIENATTNPTGISKPDEARWCLYYGVKAIVSQLSLIEAKVFLALLDEKLAEDEVTFLFHCYRTLDALMGGKMSWGPLHHCLSYESFTREFEAIQTRERAGKAAAAAVAAATGGSPTTSSAAMVDPRDTVPRVIWISTLHAKLATAVVLSKATEEERLRLEKQISNVSRSDLPTNEWPLFYLDVLPSPGGTRRGISTVEPMVMSSFDLTGQELPDRHQAPKHLQPRSPVAFIDANLWIEYMLHEYREEQAHRKAAIRLMFQTATSSEVEGEAAAATQEANASGSNAVNNSSSSLVPSSMDLDQFRAMVRTLNDEISCASIATMYRNVYVKGCGIVGFESFMEVAETTHFFSSCLRLENPVSSITRLFGNGLNTVSGTGVTNSHAMEETNAFNSNKTAHHAQSAIATLASSSSKAAWMVHRGFVLLQNELMALMENLPVSMRTTSDVLSFEVASRLEDGDGIFFGDGLRLMTGFHVLLQELLHYKLTKAELTGGSHLNSRAVFMLDKALNGLWDCVRVQDKTPVEMLMTAVKQKLSVTRVQLAFRGHLHRDEGAPLAIRHLLHRDYGSGRTRYRNRRAFRSIKWLLCVISDCLRYSCFSARAQLLEHLGSISSMSSDFMTSNAAVIKTAASKDESDTSAGGKSGTQNDGTSAKPLLMEMLYDYFLEHFGTRWEAEKLIHDVFVNCRVHLNAHPRVLLFTSLCSMASASDDRLLGQNEALAFLNAILKSGLHPFRAIRSTHNASVTSLTSTFGEATTTTSTSASSSVTSEGSSPALNDEEGDDIADMDLMPSAIAERILFMAFDRLKIDQKQRLRMRMEETLLFVGSVSATAASRRRSSTGPTSPTGSNHFNINAGSGSGEFIDADAFLNFALHEWKRYVLHRMNEVRMACCLVHDQEDATPLFEQLLSLDTVLSILQRAQVQCSNADAALVFRRVCASQGPALSIPRPSSRDRERNDLSSYANRNGIGSRRGFMNMDNETFADRLAAATYPLITRETLEHLHLLDDSPMSSLSMPTSLVPIYPPESFQLLMACWEPYESTCHTLHEQLKKHLEVERLSAAAATSTSSSVATSSARSSSLSNPSASRLTKDELLEIETLMMKFYDQRSQLREIFAPTSNTSEDAKALSTPVLLATRMAPTTVSLLNDSWKSFRRLLAAFVRARGAARRGIGPVPDQWDVNGLLGF